MLGHAQSGDSDRQGSRKLKKPPVSQIWSILKERPWTAAGKVCFTCDRRPTIIAVPA